MDEEPQDKELYARIDTMTSDELDQLPRGAMQLDTSGKILQYNLFEQRMANIRKKYAMGRNFFTEVAPCTDVKEFHGRFIEGVSKKSLHETFRYHFPFSKNPVDVSITLHYSAISNTVWVFVRGLDN
jgi:photoactive yellow protein